jgi:hypothetical protein
MESEKVPYNLALTPNPSPVAAGEGSRLIRFPTTAREGCGARDLPLACGSGRGVPPQRRGEGQRWRIPYLHQLPPAQPRAILRKQRAQTVNPCMLP